MSRLFKEGLSSVLAQLTKLNKSEQRGKNVSRLLILTPGVSGWRCKLGYACQPYQACPPRTVCRGGRCHPAERQCLCFFASGEFDTSHETGIYCEAALTRVPWG